MKARTKPSIVRQLEEVAGRKESDESEQLSPQLCELVSVDNGTCTVKESYDGTNLIDEAEITGVAYDADNAPSAGDLGLLVRLGDGSLFFFRKAGAYAVHQAGSKRLVSESGSPTYLIYEETYNGSWGISTEGWLIWKFTTAITIPAGSSAVAWTDELVQGPYVTFSKTVGQCRSLRALVRFGFVLEDFTLGTIDKTDRDALSASWKVLYPSTGGASTAYSDTLPGGIYGVVGAGTPDSEFRFVAQVSGAVTIYGLALFAPGVDIFTGSGIGNGDVRKVFTPAADANVEAYVLRFDSTAAN